MINEWGKTAEITKPLKFPCPKNTAAFKAEPNNGPSPLNVTFTDQSYEKENITTWRWSFGDGTYYYTSNKTNPDPPPHTYSRAGTFSASLTVENQCGQSFANTSVFVVSKEASIGGKIWLDRDEDGTQSADERGIAGWTIDLEERISGNWEKINSTVSDANGNYHFDIQGVSNSVFRIREHIPDTSIWRVTKSYGTYKDVVSDNILIYDKRHYENVDFGNNRLQTSKISIPGVFVLKRTGGKGFYDDNYLFKYTSLPKAAQYLDYNTTYDSNPRVVFYSSTPSPNGSFNPDPVGGYPNGYTSWGDSSFTLKLRKYNTYLKEVGKGAYFLDLWQYNNGTGWKNYYSGDSFAVPDNTTIDSTQLRLIYYFHPENVFEFDKPDEGALIPYIAEFTVEAHMEGLNENKDHAWLISPETKRFIYNSTVGEYLVTKIDTRTYEGQTKLFKGQMNLTGGSKIFCYANATIDWEPNSVSIINITSDIPYGGGKTVKGNTTVWASIGGKWQMNQSAKLIVNNKDAFDMTLMSPGVNSKVKVDFNSEPYAGKTIPVYVSVPHAKGLSYQKNSEPWNITVLSKLPLQANYTAYPWEGRAPHEVAFTDLSTGGANSWTWNFRDGVTSTKQNPIHFFNSTGNFSVRLTVTNASPATSFIEKNITVTGDWHQANLLTNRATSLAAGGMINFISRGTNSTITVNNSSYMIPDGSVVNIRLNEVHKAGKIFMAGGITECNLTNVTLKIDDVTVDSGQINEIRIQDFENFHSTLSLTAERSYSKWISFQWDRIPVTVSYRNDLIIYDLMPTTERFMS
ncbi:PKD domain-containing protein, partial [Methanospirillum sp.]|uniref:PKD domain-containing protein n=1 Tax=Methanospirillum sp. TaxID=45200 RepID=UPI001BD5F7C8